MESEPEISWPRVAAFVRQHTHDVRNGLNAIDLETALLQEIATADEVRASAAQVRQHVRTLAEKLRALAALFQEPQPYLAPLAARELFLIWREQNDSLPEPPAVEWIEEVGDAKVTVDAGMMAAIFRELLANARSFREGEPAIASAQCEGADVIFELREPKSAPVATERWGRHLFETTKRGGYGLGLWTVQQLAGANGTPVSRRNDDGALVTRIAVPAAN